MAFPKVKISDDSGNTVGVDTSSNSLNVKLVESIDSVDMDNLNDVYVISSVDGEDVQWVYYV